jgi:hypothetical protein
MRKPDKLHFCRHASGTVCSSGNAFFLFLLLFLQLGQFGREVRRRLARDLQYRGLEVQAIQDGMPLPFQSHNLNQVT